MNQPMLPEAIRTRIKYPFFGDLQLNLWAVSAIGMGLAARWGFRQPWLQTGASRWTIALIPLVPSLLYVRRLGAWTRTLDEMQLKILKEALVFAAMWTVFIRMALDVFAGAQTNGWPINFHLALGIEGTFALMCSLYLIGCIVANRRIQ